MAVKPGYKQTEAGVIPTEWDARQIRDVCKLINGRGFKPHEWKTVGLPIIRIQNLNGSEDFNFYSGQYNPKILVEHGQLLFAWSGSRGTSFGPHVWNGGRALLNYHTWKVVVNESKTTPEFLLHALRHLISYIEDRAHGASALVHTQKWEMEKFPILIPASLPEQRAIAAALSDVDALLGSLDRLIAKKRDLKQAAMQQLLTGQTRLLGFHGKWDAPVLGDLFTFKNGLNKAKEFFGYGTPIVNYMDVYGNRGLFASDLQGRVSLSREELRAFDVRKGDVFFTRTSETANEVGITSVMLDEPQDTVFSGFVLRARPKNDSLDDQFKKYCFTTSAVRRHITSQSTETTRALTNGRYLSAVAIARPPKPEQIAIAEVLMDMDAELAALEQRRDKTRDLKQAMMQELLTGRTWLVES